MTIYVNTGQVPPAVASGAALGATALQQTALGAASGAAKVGSDGYVGGTAGTALAPAVASVSSDYASGKIPQSSQTGGLSALRAGIRQSITLTDPKYGCVADNTTDNATGILAAITDAQSLNLPIYAPGAALSYAFSGNINFPDGVDLIGDGIRGAATTFLCLTATSRLAFGTSGVGAGINFGANPKASGSNGTHGTETGRFCVDGGNVATNPLFIGRTEATFAPIRVINGAAQPAYNAGTAYTIGQRVLYEGFTFQALRSTTGNAPTVTSWAAGAGGFPVTDANWQPTADSAGVIMQYSQNCKFHLLDIEFCAGSALVFDGGTGGHEIHLLELNACGSAGAYTCLITQSYSTPLVYAQPGKITVKQGVFERAGTGALGQLLQTAGTDIAFHDTVFNSYGMTPAKYPMVAQHFDGVHTNARLKFRDATIGDGTVTTVAAGSNGVVLSTFAGAGTLNVGSTTGFPTAPASVYVKGSGGAVVSYTGSTSTTLTGCTLVSGSGTLATGDAVQPTNAIAFAVGNGCSLDHTRTVISGGSVYAAYLLQIGGSVEDERAVWPASQVLADPSGTGNFDSITSSRHYSPVQGFSPASGNFQWQITELGTERIANIQLAAGNLGGGSGVLSWGPGTAPSSTPINSCVTWCKNGSLRARTGSNSFKTIAGNVQSVTTSAGYTFVEGDVGALVNAPAATAVPLILPLAATVGIGTEIWLRRTENSTGTVSLAPAGSDNLYAFGSTVSATLAIAGSQAIAVVSNGATNWYQR